MLQEAEREHQRLGQGVGVKRITIEPEKCGGLPCIRGMRMRVTDVLQLFSAGASYEEILEAYPDLEHEREDILAAIEYAAHQAFDTGSRIVEIR